jgi:hypothetical protein
MARKPTAPVSEAVQDAPPASPASSAADDAPDTSPVAESAQPAAPAAADGSKRGIRLTDEQRAEILRLKAEGHANNRIAEIVATTPATVGRVLAVAGGGAATQRRREPAPAGGMSETQRRIYDVGLNYLLKSAQSEDEVAALRTLLDEQVTASVKQAEEEAAAMVRAARERALRNLR